MHCVARIALPACALLLAACEAKLTVELTDGPVDTADAVNLEITHVALLTDDNQVVRVALDDASPIDLLLFQKGETVRLVDNHDIDNGRYVGIALDFASGGSTVERNDGATIDVITPTSRDFAPIDLGIDDLAEETLVIDLNLRFSLDENAAGDYVLTPVWRAVRPGEAGTITGSIAKTTVEATACRAGRPAGEGVAVYLFEGTGVTPGDYIGQPGLIDAARVELDATSNLYAFELHFVPEGDYTVAWTCQADDDDPSSDDAVAFEDSENVTVPADDTVTVDFP
jgi:hypothetical protein